MKLFKSSHTRADSKVSEYIVTKAYELEENVAHFKPPSHSSLCIKRWIEQKKIDSSSSSGGHWRERDGVGPFFLNSFQLGPFFFRWSFLKTSGAFRSATEEKLEDTHATSKKKQNVEQWTRPRRMASSCFHRIYSRSSNQKAKKTVKNGNGSKCVSQLLCKRWKCIEIRSFSSYSVSVELWRTCDLLLFFKWQVRRYSFIISHTNLNRNHVSYETMVTLRRIAKPSKNSVPSRFLRVSMNYVRKSSKIRAITNPVRTRSIQSPHHSDKTR